ncbi:site-specific integrase [Belliella pelovolcani]|uniref:site-specific integrase n=1 Tax=Belliella pelovolcani TaxID=529505 RepID=UPI00391AEE74
MIEKTFSILFYLKSSRNDKGNERQINARITVNSVRVEISTRLKCEKEKWSTVSNRALGKSEKVRQINSYLDIFSIKAFEARKYLLEYGKDITAENIKKVLHGETEDKRMILEIFAEHNLQMEALVGKDFAPGTLERYRTSYDHTKEFIKWKYKKKDLEIKKLDYEFISEYAFWLKSVRGCAHNTTVKYLGNFKKIVLSCVKKGWLIRDPFISFKMAKKEVQREFLSADDLNLIAEKEFRIERLCHVRDIFLFSCYTGLAYIDVKNLRRNHVIVGVDKEKWIVTKRQKTDTSVRVPLLPFAMEIINKYWDYPKCVAEETLLPVLSNQKMNSYLKEIADLCGIEKELTFHIARHTFATTITLANGVPMETVSKLLGHSSLKQTQHYAKILDNKISQDMLQLRGKLEKY